MQTDHLAIITWIEPKATEQLPAGLQYIGLSRFASDGPEWPNGSYSVVCRFAMAPSEHGGPIEARVHFLVDNAPHDRLAPGVSFQLYEGRREVACVDILW